jgi:hypothetical protein
LSTGRVAGLRTIAESAVVITGDRRARDAGSRHAGLGAIAGVAVVASSIVTAAAGWNAGIEILAAILRARGWTRLALSTGRVACFWTVAESAVVITSDRRSSKASSRNTGLGAIAGVAVVALAIITTAAGWNTGIQILAAIFSTGHRTRFTCSVCRITGFRTVAKQPVVIARDRRARLTITGGVARFQSVAGIAVVAKPVVR